MCSDLSFRLRILFNGQGREIKIPALEFLLSSCYNSIKGNYLKANSSLKGCSNVKNDGLLNFFGNCVLGVAIIVASCIIAFNLPDTTQVPSSLSVNTQNGQIQFGDYLSYHEVAVYLGISSDEADRLIESGAIDSAIYKVGETYIISKQALSELVNSKIGKD